MKNIKIVLAGFITFCAIMFLKTCAFASTTFQTPLEVNTDISNSIVYTSTTRSAVNVGQRFNVDLKLHNQETSAEDITIKYDNTKLRFNNLTTTNAGVIVLDTEHKQTTPSAVRLIITSNGGYNVINTDTRLISLSFTATTTGDAVVYTDNCTITDGISMERKLQPSEMGGCIIKINCDVDGDGQFTLLDLGIIARHLGEKVGDTPQYTMDLNADGFINFKDLEKAKQCMLKNPNY